MVYSLCFRALLYWSDWGNNDSIPARIERAYFDGSDRRTIVTFDTGIVPLGIFVDISNSILYWAASNGTIGRCNFRGRRSRIIYNGTTVKNTDGITIVDDYIYWIDKTAGSIWKASKDDASDARVALKGLTHLRGISSADMVADSSMLQLTHMQLKVNYQPCSVCLLQAVVIVNLIIIIVHICVLVMPVVLNVIVPPV